MIAVVGICKDCGGIITISSICNCYAATKGVINRQVQIASSTDTVKV